ncbi:MAG: type II secretion system F family protein [Noviherbaspirillum sp.]
MTQQTLMSIAIALLAAALLLVGASLLRRARSLARNEKTIDRLIAIREQATDMQGSHPGGSSWLDRLIAAGTNGVDSPLGRQLVAKEDLRLLHQCGVNDSRSKALFFVTRALLAILLPLLTALLFSNGSGLSLLITIYFGFAIGYMVPKSLMQRVASRRKRMASDELPLLIDLLRLLQGVGLSIDQSLHVIEQEFRGALKVLCHELEIASRQYRAGRSREQSLRRLGSVFENEDLKMLTKLIVEVEQHGGAVQEPLKQFSERIRDQRKLELKERIGKLTVKMTTVMVVTLLPALLTITGGAAFLAVIRALKKIGGDL